MSSRIKELDFTGIDKSKFKCFQMDNGTVYYGELVHQNP